MSEDPVKVDQWCNIFNETLTCNYKLTIHNFMSTKNLNKPIESSSFSAGQGEWIVIINPKSSQNIFENGPRSFKTALELKLQLKSSKKSETNAACTFTVLNKEGVKTEYKIPASFSFRSMKVSEETYGEYLIKLETLQEKAETLLPNGTLAILCELQIQEEPVNNAEKSQSLARRIENLSTSFGNLLNSNKFTDVVICIGDKEINAHRAILAQRSEVFEAMFDSDMKESKEGRVEVKDIEYTVFLELLRFMYTGKADNVMGIAMALLAAANKYCVLDLKLMCEDTLCQQLTVNNVCKLLKVACVYSCNRLEAQALTFIAENLSAVEKTKEFMTVIKTQPDMVAKIFGVVASKQVSLELEKTGEDLLVHFPVTIATVPFRIPNSDQQPKIAYKPAAEHVEGGSYIGPEFLLGQVYDGSQPHSHDNKDVVVLYRPVYVAVVKQ